MELMGKISTAEVTVPVSSGLTASQGRVALDVARVSLAPVTNKHDVAVLSMVALVAHPIKGLLLRRLVLELFALDQVFLAFEPKTGHFAAAVGTLAGVLQPFL